VHHKKDNCDPASAAQAIDKGVQQYKTLLFPNDIAVEVRHGKKMRLKKGNGGWGDIRDHQLCLSFVAN
jgi:alpha-1,6-mannosyl-glycoprotein beta-1,2-N-acetylglucosaminyltransferase